MANMTISDQNQIERAESNLARAPATGRITRWRTTSSAIGILALVVALAAAVLAPHVSRARGAQQPTWAGARACDARTMRGVYAVHWTGTMLGQPLAVVGHVEFKRARRASGVITEVWNGQSTHYTFDGTHSLDAGCRGELSFRLDRPLPQQRTFEFYPTARGHRASFVLAGAQVKGVPTEAGQELLANSSIVLSGLGERLSRRRMTCDEESMRGAYMGRFDGTTALGSLTAVGRAELDGEGGVSLEFTAAAEPTVDRDNLYAGTYSVHPGCRGEIRVSGRERPHFGLGDHHVIDFYAAARGRRAFMITTKSWVDEIAGTSVDPLGINEDLAQGNEQDLNLTFSGVAERR